MRPCSRFTLRDTQDIPLYGFSWGPRLYWTRWLHARPIGLLLVPSASPSFVGIFVHQLYNVVSSLCMTLDPPFANVGLTNLRALPMLMHDVSGLWSKIPLSFNIIIFFINGFMMEKKNTNTCFFFSSFSFSLFPPSFFITFAKRKIIENH